MINTVGPGAVNIFINRQAMSLRIPTKTLVPQGCSDFFCHHQVIFCVLLLINLYAVFD